MKAYAETDPLRGTTVNIRHASHSRRQVPWAAPRSEKGRKNDEGAAARSPHHALLDGKVRGHLGRI